MDKAFRDAGDEFTHVAEDIEKGEFDVMATRGMIARTDGTHMTGVYHHWDSYPSGLGAMLYSLYNGHFQRDSKAMLEMLIDQHPAGWSTINDKDFSLAPGWSEFLFQEPYPESVKMNGQSEDEYIAAMVAYQVAVQAYQKRLSDALRAYNASEQARRPQCYCHGERHEEPRLIHSFADATKCWAEYAYVIDVYTDQMGISACSDKEWREIAQVILYEPEPNWQKLDCL